MITYVFRQIFVHALTFTETEQSCRNFLYDTIIGIDILVDGIRFVYSSSQE